MMAGNTNTARSVHWSRPKSSAELATPCVKSSKRCLAMPLRLDGEHFEPDVGLILERLIGRRLRWPSVLFTTAAFDGLGFPQFNCRAILSPADDDVVALRMEHSQRLCRPDELVKAIFGVGDFLLNRRQPTPRTDDRLFDLVSQLIQPHEPPHIFFANRHRLPPFRLPFAAACSPTNSAGSLKAASACRCFRIVTSCSLVRPPTSSSIDQSRANSRRWSFV